MKIYFLIGAILVGAFLECHAQSNITTWSQKYETYQSVWNKPTLQLIFNQDKFSPGDTAWFKAYFLKEDLSFIQDKQLIDLNLVDSNGDSRLHLVFNVNNGVGQNQLVIPSTMEAGIYLVSAYNGWMKNFDPAFIFKKEITVVKENGLIANKKLIPKVIVEGGHLIRDVSNKVAMAGYPSGAALQIVDGGGQEVAKTNADINGIASVVFMPQRNTTYNVKTIDGAGQVSFPAVEENGIALQLTPSLNPNDPVKVILTSPVGSAFRSEEITFIISGKGKIYHSGAILQGAKDFIELEIPSEKLPEGVAHISLLSRTGNLIASRDFYNQNEGLVQVKIQSDKSSFQLRERIRLEVSVTNSKGQPVEGEFAIGVTNSGLFEEKRQNTLFDQLTILTGATDKIIIDRSNPNWITHLDNYLITATKEVPWNVILKSELTRPQYNASSVIQRSGKVYNSETNELVPDLTQITFYLQKNKTLYHTFTDKGTVWLTIPAVFGQDEIFYLAETKRKQIPSVRVVWETDSIVTAHASASKVMKDQDPYASFATKSRLIDKSFGFYSSTEKSVIGDKTVNPNTEFEDEIMGADITIKVQNFILFPTLEELIKEVIPPMYTRRLSQRTIVRVKLPEPMNTNITGDPVYVIDGIATSNTAFFLSLKPVDLLTIKIVKDPVKLSRFGLMGKNGIVIVQTKNGDVREPVDPSRLIAGLSKVLNFKIHDYSKAQDLHKPDFRSTIYWNPSVKTDSNGKASIDFFCSDDVGKLKIRIDGMATGGKPFSAEQEIEVANGVKN